MKSNCPKLENTEHGFIENTEWFRGLLVHVVIPASFKRLKLRMLTTFFLECLDFHENFNLLWSKRETKILTLNVADGMLIVSFIKNMDHQ